MVASGDRWSIRVNFDVILDPDNSDGLHQEGQQLAVLLYLCLGGDSCWLHPD